MILLLDLEQTLVKLDIDWPTYKTAGTMKKEIMWNAIQKSWLMFRPEKVFKNFVGRKFIVSNNLPWESDGMIDAHGIRDQFDGVIPMAGKPNSERAARYLDEHAEGWRDEIVVVVGDSEVHDAGFSLDLLNKGVETVFVHALGKWWRENSFWRRVMK